MFFECSCNDIRHNKIIIIKVHPFNMDLVMDIMFLMLEPPIIIYYIIDKYLFCVSISLFYGGFNGAGALAYF